MITKSLITSALLVASVSGCGTNMSVQKTGNTNEYVINRDDKSPFGSLASVNAAVAADAATFCGKLNKKVSEKYSIDKERAVLVWPETTLYFECLDPSASAGADSSQLKPANDAQRSSKVYEDLLKLDELRKKGVITEAEFESEKKKLLSSK
jgi:hypothetical protein